MMFTPPTQITFRSDGNVLAFERVKKGKGEVQYIYCYVVSKTKIGLELGLTETGIQKLINRALIKTSYE